MKNCKHCNAKIHDWSPRCHRCGGGVCAPTTEEIRENNRDVSGDDYGFVLVCVFVVFILIASILK